MKFAAVLTILLIFVVVIANANPVEIKKRKLGNNIVTTGVKFKDLYESLNNKVKKVEKAYDAAIPSFDDEVKKAAEKDGTEVPEFLTKWNKKYEALSVKYAATSKAMADKIAKLDKFLKEN